MTCKDIIKFATFMLDNSANYPDLKRHQLYSCKAWTLQSKYSKWILLQSYNTIVAAYDKNTETLFVFGYYSATTSQHVAKFRKWLLKEMNPRPVSRVNLYNDSRLASAPPQRT